jgi:tetratricopeptide (TPR) repeat protein
MIWSARGFAPLLLFFSFLWVCPLHAQTQGLDGLLEGAGVAQSSGHYAEAAALYAQATALAPSQPELWSNRGVMEFLSGQIDASITSLKRASVLDPHLFTPLLFLGKDYLQTGKSASALPYLNQAHTLKPNDPEVLLALGKINLDTGQPRTASALYADAVHIIPSNPAAWFGLGVSSLQLISADGWTLASTNAQSPWARSLYADELFAQGRPREATETYHALLAQATPATKTSLARNLAWMQAHEELLQLPPSSREALLALNAQIGPQTLHMATSPCDTEPLEDAACAYRKSNYERSAAEADKALRKTHQSQSRRTSASPSPRSHALKNWPLSRLRTMFLSAIFTGSRTRQNLLWASTGKPLRSIRTIPLPYWEQRWPAFPRISCRRRPPLIRPPSLTARLIRN